MKQSDFILTLRGFQRVCYAREYATPVIALNDMTRLPFAGLSVSEMKKQAKQFAEFSNEIMKHEKFNKEIGDVKDKCSIVYFEGLITLVK
jgi:hypothetical protein